MEKLKMQTPDLTANNIEQLALLFPHVITESRDESGKIKKAVDFDLLRQVLAKDLVEADDERYRLDWPGKKAALLKANTPITKTLRPCREESVNFDTTENLYIEGDNFEVLKILQESYLGQIKMIYIDPPYNTGNDFIYKDNFKQSKEDYEAELGTTDEEGGKLFKNTDSNGRFHSDWLSMMYERLIVARDLLKDDGVIFISIDDGEQDNLKKICDEVFGEENFRNYLIIRRRVKSLNVQFADSGLRSMNVGFEYVLIYSKSSTFLFKALRMQKENASLKGSWNVFWSGADRPTMRYDLLGFTPSTGQWRWSKEKAEEAVKNYEVYLKDFSEKLSLEDYLITTNESLKFIRRISDGIGKNGGVQYWIPPSETSLRSSNWTDIEVSQIHKEFDLAFDNPKSTKLIKTIIETYNGNNFTILDFFSGSATTAHAVMQLNAEDGGNRKFIMVQLPEKTDENSEAYKAGYSTIAEIGKERIRRAGKKILESVGVPLVGARSPGQPQGIAPTLDIGFRVYKVDSSNLKEVFYHPAELKQDFLAHLESNIKADRTPEDLLIQVMLDLGLTLDLPIETRIMQNNTVYLVQTNALIACFDNHIDFKIVDQIAELKPLKVVFKDASFKDDKDRINVTERFKRLSPETKVTVI